MKSYKEIDGWLDEDEADILRELATEVDGPIVEFGSFRGRSTVVMAGTGKTVHAVDFWQDFPGTQGGKIVKGKDVEKDFLKHTEGLPVIQHKMLISEFEPIPADLVFCDAEHTFEETCIQIEKAFQCNPRYIALHDYTNEAYAEGVRRAVAELLPGPMHRKVNRIGVWKLR